MDEKVAPLEKMTLGAATERMIAELKKLFPEAEFLIQGETYGDAEDIIVKIFAPEDELIEISDKAHEISLRYDLETSYFILPMVIPIEHYPIKLN